MTATESKTEYVVLVDKQNRIIGSTDKLSAHQNNLLHRAFSVFIFRYGQEWEVLLQQRAFHKYHSPGLWTNACCSHPRINEEVVRAGERRLQEEIGITTPLKDIGWFYYNAHFDNGLSEHEIDHVLVGTITDETPSPNPDEVHSFRFIPLSTLQKQLKNHPEQFTAWFPKAFEIASSVFVV